MKRRGLLGLVAAVVGWAATPFRARAEGRILVSTPEEGRLDMIVQRFDPQSDWLTGAEAALERHHPEGRLHTILVAFVPMSRETAPEVEPPRQVRLYRNGNQHSWRVVIGLAWGEYKGRVRDANPGYYPNGSWGVVVHVTTLPAEQASDHYEGLSVEFPDGVRSYVRDLS